MTTSSTDQTTASNADQITSPQGLQDDISDTIEAIPTQPTTALVATTATSPNTTSTSPEALRATQPTASPLPYPVSLQNCI